MTKQELTQTQKDNFRDVLTVLVQWFCLYHRSMMVKDLAKEMKWSEGRVRKTLALCEDHSECWSKVETYSKMRGFSYSPTKAHLADLYTKALADLNEVQECQSSQCKQDDIKPLVADLDEQLKSVGKVLAAIKNNFALDEYRHNLKKDKGGK